MTTSDYCSPKTKNSNNHKHMETHARLDWSRTGGVDILPSWPVKPAVSWSAGVRASHSTEHYV
jgi:hypothetical protein